MVKPTKERGVCIVVSESNDDSRSTNHGTSRRRDGNSRGPLPVASKRRAFLDACRRHSTLSEVAAELGISTARASDLARKMNIRVKRMIQLPA